MDSSRVNWARFWRLQAARSLRHGQPLMPGSKIDELLSSPNARRNPTLSMSHRGEVFSPHNRRALQVVPTAFLRSNANSTGLKP